MTSTKKIKANPNNGKKGGVKTDAGKAIVKHNALKHGLLAQKSSSRWVRVQSVLQSLLLSWTTCRFNLDLLDPLRRCWWKKW